MLCQCAIEDYYCCTFKTEHKVLAYIIINHFICQHFFVFFLAQRFALSLTVGFANYYIGQALDLLVLVS